MSIFSKLIDSLLNSGMFVWAFSKFYNPAPELVQEVIESYRKKFLYEISLTELHYRMEGKALEMVQCRYIILKMIRSRVFKEVAKDLYILEKKVRSIKKQHSSEGLSYDPYAAFRGSNHLLPIDNNDGDIFSGTLQSEIYRRTTSCMFGSPLDMAFREMEAARQGKTIRLGIPVRIGKFDVSVWREARGAKVGYYCVLEYPS